MSGLHFGMVTTFYPPFNFGGDGIGVQRLSRALVRLGHRVTVVHDVDAFLALRPSGPNGTDSADDGVEVVHLRSGAGPLSPLLTQQLGRPVLTRRPLRHLLEHSGFDVIHFNNISLIGGPGVLGFGEAVKLYEAHEHWLVCPSHVLWRHNREPCTGRECLRCVLHFRRPPQLWRYTGLLERQLQHIDAFIAKSEFSRAKHRDLGFRREMSVVPYFLPETQPSREPINQPPHPRPYFLFVGRLERIKGLDDVLPVFRDYPDADLLIAGEGEHGAHLRTLASGSERIRFLGQISPEALRAYYHHALALVVPSAGYETFGIILIEAFRQGTPVIARRIGPFPEIVERGGGLLFDTPAELLSALRRLQGETELRARLARSAYAGFLKHWSESAVLPQYLDVVRHAASRKRRHRVAEILSPQSVR